MSKLTSANLNRLFKNNGYNVTMHRGPGYWYFISENPVSHTMSHSVYVMLLSDLSESDWLSEAKYAHELLNEPTN